MVNQDDVKRIALSLPEVSQKPGEFSFVVDGKLFAWVYPERIAPKKPRVPNKDVIAVMVAGEGEKQIMLAAAPDKFFTTSHYDGHRSVLVRLPAIEADELEDLLTDAWRCRAPARLIKAFDIDNRPCNESNPQDKGYP